MPQIRKVPATSSSLCVLCAFARAFPRSTVRLISAVFFFFLTLTPLLAQPKDTLLTMSDGAKISITYYRPQTSRPPEGYPALVLIHGFAGSKNDYAPYAHRYADSGYFCVAYTVRGQGQANPATASEGNFAWFTGDRELEDCRAVVEWARAHPLVNGERVGIEGVSQGGLTAWGAAVRGLNVRCVTPLIGVPLYSEAMAANGAENYFLAAALAGADVFKLVRFDTWCYDSLYRAIQEDRYDDVKRLLQQRDLTAQISTIRVPVFIQMAWQDELFSGGQFFKAFDALDVPKKLCVWPGAHALPTGVLETGRMALTFRFYRRWLKGDESEGIMNPDSAVTLVDAGNGMVRWFHPADSGYYRPGDAALSETRRMYFTGQLRLSEQSPAQPAVYERLYVQNITNDAYVFRTEPLADTLRLLGAAASLMVNSTGRKYQANVLLWDFDSAANTRRPITRGSYEVRLQPGENSSRRRVGYDLSPQLYTMAKGHQLEAWVKFGIPGLPVSRPGDEFGQTPYPPQESAIDTLFTSPAEPSWLDLHVLRDNVSAVTRQRSDDDRDGLAMLIPAVIRDGAPIIIHPDGRQPCIVELFDSRGVCVHAGESDAGEVIIPTHTLPRGLYFLRMRSSGTLLNRRFIVVN